MESISQQEMEMGLSSKTERLTDLDLHKSVTSISNSEFLFSEARYSAVCNPVMHLALCLSTDDFPALNYKRTSANHGCSNA
jgi:hypothetical protein